MDTEEFLLKHAWVVARDTVMEDGWVRVSGGGIIEMGQGKVPHELATLPVVNAAGQWLVPGFIDLHSHGGDGADVMEGVTDAIRQIGRFHAQHGTTGWLPTTMTAPVDAIERSVRAVAAARATETPDGAAILGMHLEGPMLSPAKVGAQHPDYIVAPSVGVLQRLLTLTPGLVRKVTIAPEVDGALPVIEYLTREGVISSIGHSDASFAETLRGIEAGARHATHLFNAMRGIHHRDGGTAGACLADERVVCEVIADGHHVNYPVLQLVVRLKGPEGLMLITDSISAAGCPAGAYELGGQAVTVARGVCTLAGTSTLAGSILTMDEAVRNMVRKVGVSLCEAVVMASETPAKALGLAHRKGRIQVGFDADLVLLDESLTPVRTWVQGRQVHRR